LAQAKPQSIPITTTQLSGKIHIVRGWLIVRPAHAKLSFVKHVHKAHHDLNDHLIGVETVDHPTDQKLLANARRYFLAAHFVAADRTLG